MEFLLLAVVAVLAFLCAAGEVTNFRARRKAERLGRVRKQPTGFPQQS